MDLETLLSYFLILLSKIGKAVNKPGSNTTAGQIPVADGSGGYTWGAATSAVVSATDTNNDGNVEILFTEGS